MRHNQFYCVKCKDRVNLNPSGIKMKVLRNGRHAMTSTCDHCGTKVFKFVKMTKSPKKSPKKSKRKSRKRSKKN